MSWHVRVVPNQYADSVRLMGIAQRLREREGVERGEMAMGTEANLAALAHLGAQADASAGDVVLAVDGEEAVASDALDEAERELGSGGGGGEGAQRAELAPRSLVTAVGRLSEPNLAIVSVPGENAVLESHRALSSGLHVFLFSDGVAVEDELDLKRRGDELGLLVMGPECGTSMLAGVGLGFANVVRPGPVGVVSAGGTGAQEVACLLDAAGVGVSQIVGVGGRDLSPEIGGIMFRRAIALLASDESTETLLLVSKPPAPEVVSALADVMPDGRRVVAAFVGWEGGDAPFEVHSTLEAGALAAAGVEAPSGTSVGELETAVDGLRERSAGRALLGLYSGGSLAHEAVTILEPELGPVGGNAGHASNGDTAHAIEDLGEAEYTRGRPHPMIDVGVRRERLERAAGDERVGCVLLDVVLGYGAADDPAGELAEAVGAVADRAVVIAHVCGTPADPQDLHRQEAELREPGALTAPSGAAAVRLGLRAVRGED